MARDAGEDERQGGHGWVDPWGAATIGGGGKTASTSGSSVVFEQTAESYTSRLLNRLEEEGQLVRLDTPAAEVPRRGTVVAVEGVFELVDFANDKPEELFAPGLECRVALYALGTGDSRVPVGTIQAESSAVAAPLEPDHLRIQLDEVTGDIAEDRRNRPSSLSARG